MLSPYSERPTPDASGFSPAPDPAPALGPRLESDTIPSALATERPEAHGVRGSRLNHGLSEATAIADTELHRSFGSVDLQAPLASGTVDAAVQGGELERLAFAGVRLCDSGFDVHCGLTVVPAGRAPETVAATSDVPVRVDWLQHELREGPVTEARLDQVLAIDDLAANKRWPDFGKMCVAVMRVRSMVSIRIPFSDGDRAALTLYSDQPEALERLHLPTALRLARIAAPRLEHLLDALRARLLGPPASDYSRVSIAVGTIMARERVNVAEAFRLLCLVSRDLGRAMLDVAIDTAVNGRLPSGAAPGTAGPGTSRARSHVAAGRRHGYDTGHST